MFGVVSLTMGNSVFPAGNRLTGHKYLFRKLVLWQSHLCPEFQNHILCIHTIITSRSSYPKVIGMTSNLLLRNARWSNTLPLRITRHSGTSWSFPNYMQKALWQYAREPFMRREYGKSKNRKRICNLSCFPESLLHLSLYPYKTRLHQKARFAFTPISRFVLILTDNYCSARCLYLA